MKETRRLALVSLGCPKNQVDSELMLGRLRAAGFELVADPSDADTLLINTCAFIDHARAESVEALVQAAEWKQQETGRSVIAAGCLVQRHGDELRQELPEIDGWAGLDDIARVAAIAASSSAPKPLGTLRRLPSKGPARGLFTADDPRQRISPPWSAYVKISEGCDQQCAFCAIPTFRGKNRSRPLDDLLEELGRLAQQGVQEANLIAQDSTGWGRDLGLREGLATLVDALEQLDEAPSWIRLHYLYPGRISSEFIAALSRSRRIVPYIDLPLQHADPAVLKRMRRPGDAESYLRQLEALERALPGAAIRTGFIVGFPGETDKEFETLLEFVAAERFDAAGVFTYSKEPSTSAFALADDIPPELKEERRQALSEAVDAAALSRLERRIGSRLRVLVEGPDEEESGMTRARWAGQAPEVDGCVLVDSIQPLQPGSFVAVDIFAAEPYRLRGRLEAAVQA